MAWEKEATAYEVGFKQQGKKLSVVSPPAGVWQEVETNLLPAQLLAAGRATLHVLKRPVRPPVRRPAAAPGTKPK